MPLEWTEFAVKDALLGNVVIQDLAGDRVYPLKAPDAVLLPFVVYERNSGQPNYILAGYNSEDVIMTIRAFGKTYAETKALALGVRKAMAGMKAMLRTDRDFYYNDADAYGVIMEFYCFKAGGYCDE